VCELLGEAGVVAPSVLEARDCYEQALAAYVGGRFAEAALGFHEAARLWPEDSAAAVMVERARELAHEPAPSGWSGVFDQTVKL
jgi:hypothetical protein